MLPKLKAEVGPDFRLVDGQSGITVNCGDIECVFEFIVYQYSGEPKLEEKQWTGTLADLMGQGDEGEASYDNDAASNQMAQVTHSQAVPGASENDQDESSFASPPPVVSELQVGGVYDFSQMRPSQAQRRNMPAPIPQPKASTDEGEHSRLPQMEDDFSPRAREMRMKLKHSKRSTLRKSMSSTSSSERGPRGDNRYTAPSTTTQCSVADTDEPHQPDNDRDTSSSSEQPLITASSTTSGAQGSSDTRSSSASPVQRQVRLAQTRQQRSSSSSRPLLSSIEESSGSEGSVVSPPPVFNEQ